MPAVEGMVAAVLDTHVWVWMAMGDRRAEPLRAFTGIPIVAAISVWELAKLEQKGRIALSPDAETWIRTNLEPPIRLEPLSPAIALASCRLPDFHGDPADRLIVATALACGVPLITADARILDWSHHHPHLTVVPI